MEEEKKKQIITIDNKEFVYDELSQEQQRVVQHITNLNAKLNDVRFQMEQLEFARDAYVKKIRELIKETTPNKEDLKKVKEG